MPRHPVIRTLALVVAATFATTPLPAHEPGDHDHDHEAHVPMFPEGLILPALDGARPWSDKPILNDPDRFQIAIVTDNTGGHRPGIWMKAVKRLNLLRPEFVVSVGDLIEGYSEDRKQIESEWQEFTGFIDQMEMKFFFVAGNHDLSNPVMHDIWREHFGPEWYSFDYRGVHFMCLNSEDPDEHIGDEQLAWITKDLEEHADARWTLLFFHKPMWLRADRELAAGNADPTNWKKVEQLLGSRPHTVFSGHVHHYVQYDRNGMKYYHLATTGGASQLRGVPYGEFDHVTWLTMEQEGPSIAHLLLDGILPPEEVTEESIARFRNFLAQTRIEIAPVLLDEHDHELGFTQGRIDIRLTNGFDTAVETSGKIDGLPLKGLYVEPASLKLAAAAGQTAELSVDVRFAEPIAFDHLAETLLTVKLRSVEEQRPLTAERTVPVIIDRAFRALPAPSSVAIDGNLEEWEDLPLATPESPLILGKAENWQGPGDASFTWRLATSADQLLLAARVTDDAVTADDALTLILDGRPISARRADGRLGQGTWFLRVSAPDAAGKTEVTVHGSPQLEGVTASARRTETGYDVELALPLSAVAAPPAGSRTLQATLVQTDVDAAGEDACRIVWRGTEDVEVRNTNFGHFVLAP